MHSDSRYAVGISELFVVRNPVTEIIAANLGSCLAILAIDSVSSTYGMVHCLLPSSSSAPDGGESQPGMFVDSGLTTLLSEMVKLGATLRTIKLFAAGGASINESNAYFAIGEKNIAMFRRKLWAQNLLITYADLGGVIPRSLAYSPHESSVRLRRNLEWQEVFREKGQGYGMQSSSR